MQNTIFFVAVAAILVFPLPAFSIGDSAGGCTVPVDVVNELKSSEGEIPLLLANVERRVAFQRSSLSAWMRAKLDESPILTAAWENETRKFVISSSINCINEAPLEIALHSAHPATVKSVLAVGADPESAQYPAGRVSTVFGWRCTPYNFPKFSELSPDRKESWRLVVEALKSSNRNVFGPDVMKCQDPLLRDFLISLGAGGTPMEPPPVHFPGLAMSSVSGIRAPERPLQPSTPNDFAQWVGMFYGLEIPWHNRVRRSTFQDVAQWSAAAEKLSIFRRRFPEQFPNLDNAWTFTDPFFILPDKIVSPEGIVFFVTGTQINPAFVKELLKRRQDATIFVREPRYDDFWSPQSPNLDGNFSVGTCRGRAC